jgi:ribonuclease R
VTGTIKRHPDGYGFLIPDEKNIPDAYVAKHNMEGVMTNDKVSAKIVPDGNRFRAEGLEIQKRETTQVMGKIRVQDPTSGILKDESFGWGEDLKVRWTRDKSIRDGDFVQVRIQSYPDSLRGFQGEVVTVIGDVEDPQNDNLRVLAANSIPYGFSKEALREADALPEHVTDEDRAGRIDLRQEHFVTIDGKTAKDFDDAILVKQERDGFRLWVAIADVSHYVRPGTAIDSEAYRRGTSTYFPNFVSPMLPEALSNELCSLKPNVDRLSFVCEMPVSRDGNIGPGRMYEAVINSKARVTYGEAQEIIEGTADPSVQVKLQHVRSDILLAADLAKILMKRRFEDGSLNLEIPETVIELDSTGTPVDILKSERLFAHRLIEELMLAANIAVARFFNERQMAGLYRIHESPKLEAIELLESYLQNFGYRRAVSGGGLQKKITQALEHFSGLPQESILNILALRSMNQAQYSAENVGHFGLGFKHYTHFTSPIRRYPDLIVHRLAKSKLYQNKGYGQIALSDLQTAGQVLSASEQRSVKAERQIHAIKKARFLRKYLGQEFDGFVSSVTKFGVFVLLKNFEVDGLVKLEELGFEHFDFNEELLQLVGRSSGFRYQLGDAIKVQVAAADVQTGRIDFVLAGGVQSGHGRAQSNKQPNNQSKKHSKNQSSEERRSTKDDRERVREARFPRSGGKNKARNAKSGKTGSRRHK